MPITKSAAKALRKDLKKSIINKPIRTQYKTTIKKVKENPTLENLKEAYSSLDKAAKKRVIHKNKASRLKSKLAKLVKKEKPVKKQAKLKKKSSKKK
ncbi:30S ribosomal protein S20 [Patescibacteria group bacterium]